MVDERLWISPPQGSDGFPGSLGTAGEKGKKVSGEFKVMMMMMSGTKTFLIHSLSFVLFPRVLQDNQEPEARGVQM